MRPFAFEGAQGDAGGRGGSSSSSWDVVAPLPVLEEVPLPARVGDPVLQAPDA